MKLKIIAPEKIIFEGEIDKLSANAIDGEIEILPGHAKFITILSKGEITITSNGQEKNFAIEEGILRVKENTDLEIII